MERSKRESLNVRMKHGEDDETNKAQTWATVCAQGISQRTTTKNRDDEDTTKDEGSSMHEDSYIDINCVYAHANVFSNVLSHFTHCWVLLCASCRQLNSCRCNHLLNFDLYANSLKSSHCENGSFEVLSSQNMAPKWVREALARSAWLGEQWD